MAAGWTPEETKALVSIWETEDVQSQLGSVAWNRIIFEKNCCCPKRSWLREHLAVVQNQDKKLNAAILNRLQYGQAICRSDLDKLI